MALFYFIGFCSSTWIFSSLSGVALSLPTDIRWTNFIPGLGTNMIKCSWILPGSQTRPFRSHWLKICILCRWTCLGRWWCWLFICRWWSSCKFLLLARNSKAGLAEPEDSFLKASISRLVRCLQPMFRTGTSWLVFQSWPCTGHQSS